MAALLLDQFSNKMLIRQHGSKIKIDYEINGADIFLNSIEFHSADCITTFDHKGNGIEATENGKPFRLSEIEEKELRFFAINTLSFMNEKQDLNEIERKASDMALAALQLKSFGLTN